MTPKRRQKSVDKAESLQPRVLKAKTKNQEDYIVSIITNDIIFCTGPSGSGKSFIAAGIAAEKLLSGETDQLIITRPLVSSGKDIGALPGEVSDKVKPYLAPMEENLKYFMKGHYTQFLNDGKIRYEPLELMRGATFHDSYMILDEAQNCDSDQIKMFITRMGENSKVLINGDTKQTDLHGSSGLSFCMNKLKNIRGVAINRLLYEDIQRNGILGRVLSALEGDMDYYDAEQDQEKTWREV